MSDKIYQTSCDRTRSGVFLRLDEETGKSNGIRCPYYDSKAKPTNDCRIAHKSTPDPLGMIDTGYYRGECIMIEAKMFEV